MKTASFIEEMRYINGQIIVFQNAIENTKRIFMENCPIMIGGEYLVNGTIFSGKRIRIDKTWVEDNHRGWQWVGEGFVILKNGAVSEVSRARYRVNI